MLGLLLCKMWYPSRCFSYIIKRVGISVTKSCVGTPFAKCYSVGISDAKNYICVDTSVTGDFLFYGASQTLVIL